MTDEQTAAAIVADPMNAVSETAMEAAIVRALQAARKEGGKQVVDEAERVSQILQSENTANADNESKARFEVERFMFASAGSAVGKTLTDYQKHALFHLFKNVFDSHESALQAARTPPPGHIIDDAGVVRRVDTTGWNHADTSKPVPLPVYADGELWMIGEEAFTIVDGEVRIIYTYDHRPSWTSSGWVIRWGDGEIELNKCYANKDAAEAAKEGKA